MKTLLTFMAVVALALGPVACGKKSGTEQSPAADVMQLAEKSGPDSPEVLTELTGAVHRCWNGQGRLPKSLDEVVAAGYLKKVPQLPAGKRYVVQPQTGQVSVAP